MSITTQFEKRNISVKSAIKGQTTINTYEMIKPIGRRDSTTDGHDEYVQVEEMRTSFPDVYTIVKKKSKHKVKHDIYDVNADIVKVLSSYAEQGLYPPPDLFLAISRCQQYEQVTSSLADLKIHQSSSNNQIQTFSTGPRGGTYIVDNQGNKKYIRRDEKYCQTEPSFSKP